MDFTGLSNVFLLFLGGKVDNSKKIRRFQKDTSRDVTYSAGFFKFLIVSKKSGRIWGVGPRKRLPDEIWGPTKQKRPKICLGGDCLGQKRFLDNPEIPEPEVTSQEVTFWISLTMR